MASVDVPDDPAIRQEVIAVLSAAEQPLTARQIVAASPLFGGGATVAGHLASLVEAGIVERERDEPNKITFELRRRTADPADAPQTIGHADLILAALRDGGPLTRHQAAQAAGCSPKRATDVLGILKTRGLAAMLRPGLWAAPKTGDAVPAAKTARVAKQRATPAVTRQPAGAEMGADTRASTPIIALRSDGIVEIRRAAAAVIEIAPEEMAELQRFVASLRGAR